MANAVVILGAGASADFGVPTLAYIFKDSRARQYLNGHPRLLESLNKWFWKPRGYGLETSEQSLSIEQMLTLLKDWENETRIEDHLKPANAARFRRQLYCLIQRAVFEGKSSNAKTLNPLINICSTAFDHTTWASFNWDCIFEASFWYNSGPWRNRDNPMLAIPVESWYGHDNRHTLLKLHGGINWWLVGGKIEYVSFTGSGHLQGKWQQYESEPSITSTTPRPVILEPSFYKYEASEYDKLAPQWEFFFEQLINADYVIVVGYSLPELDIRARSTILTAFQVNEDCRWLVVDQSVQTCRLYSRLIGTARAEISQTSLSGFNNDISARLGQAFPGLNFA